MKPIIFLDFDGVINAIPRERIYVGPEPADILDMYPSKNWEWKDVTPDLETHFELDQITTAHTNGRDYKITYSSEVVAALRELIVEDKVQFIWLTTWREDAMSKLNPILGFPNDKTSSLQWFDTSISHTNPQMGKYYGMIDYFEKLERDNVDLDGTSIVWVDDVATIGFVDLTDKEKKFRIEHYAASPVLLYPSLVVKPDMHFGISRAELKSIQDFVEEQNKR